MGHMNVQFHVEKSLLGLASFGLRLGLAPRDLRARGLALAFASQHIRFLREQRPGAPFFVRAGVLEETPGGLRVLEELVSAVDGGAAATFVGEARLVRADTRQPVEVPPEALARAAALRVALPAHAAPRGLALDPPRPRPRIEEADRLGLLAIGQTVVDESRCDADGVMTGRHAMGLVSDSIPNLMLWIAGLDRSEVGRSRAGGVATMGGAALEYRFVHHAAPRLGDVLALRSGLRAVGEKTWTVCHWLFDLASGEAVATAEAVAIAMDLSTRRAAPIPPALRAALAGAVIPGLTP